MHNILISKDSKGKCRLVILSCDKASDKEEYTIIRKSGLLDGKMIDHTPLIINKGKVKRSVLEQATLEYNSHLKKYLDKGYKTLEDLGCASLAEFKKKQKSIEVSKTDQKGIGKPMLCKVYDKDDEKTQNKVYFGSKKLDGNRCFIYMKDGELRTRSRGGQDYDIAATYILQDAFIKSLFEKDPDLILDGELYRHGWNLQKISGLCRLETLHKDHTQLKFYCYDNADESQTFEQRLEYLESIVPSWNSLLVMVDHVKVSNHDEIMKLHDKYVSQGYEGLVIRDPKAYYQFGGRNRNMLKVKQFHDMEAKVIGFSEGLRDEDFVFKLVTDDGVEFEAKPIGDRKLKEWYRNNMDALIGQMATIKYFNITDKGTPNLPIFKSFRDIKDM